MIRRKNTCRGYGITMEVLTGIKMMKGINPIHSYQSVKLPPNTSLKHFIFFPSRWFSFSFSQKRTTCSMYSSVFILVLQRSTYPNPLPWSWGIFFYQSDVSLIQLLILQHHLFYPLHRQTTTSIKSLKNG